MRSRSTTIVPADARCRVVFSLGIALVCLVISEARMQLLAAESLEEQPPVGQSRVLTGEPWIDMDYGPYLTASLEVEPGNLANKGVAIRLDEGEGGVSAGNEFVLFDTDTLRYAAGWTGPEFINWENIVFDGQHVVHADIVGRTVFTNPDAPGWADSAGAFDDRRIVGRDNNRYGPMPHEWARWKGLYRHGDKVVLSYQVGGVEVLELPAAEGVTGDRTMTRTLNLGKRERDLIVQVAHDASAKIEFHELPLVGSPTSKVAVFAKESTSAVAAAESSRKTSTCAAVVGGPAGTDWIATEDGHLRLRVPAGEPTRIKLALGRVAVQQVDDFAKQVESLPGPEDLTPLTQGGPRRWTETFTTKVQPLGRQDGAYAIEDLGGPMDNPYRSWMRLGGFDFFPSDPRRAAVCTWQGDVWIVDGLGSATDRLTWTRIASGMFQPLGVKIVDGSIYVTCRDQITILRDLNGDGETDFYENFNNDHQVTEHFHEFAMDLQTDDAGNFYYAKSARHARDALVPHHGTLIKVSRDGSKSEILASGFRAVNGVCVNGDGTFIISDQEGHWTPKNRINWITPGGFYGNMMGYHEGRKVNDFVQPMVWIHNNFDRSPAEQLWVTSSQWGPLEGSLLNLSYGTGQIHVVMFEDVDGTKQGGLVRLPIPDFPTGVMRGRFHPVDGQLYCCGLFGWSSDKTNPGGFYRVRYTGKALHLPIALKASKKGVTITFTEPLDAESAADYANFAVARWNYKRTANYGSDDYSIKNRRKKGRDRVRVENAVVSADRKSVLLEIRDMKPSMQMEISYRIKAADGQALSQTIHNTIHQVGED